jgi:hypothetical protein
MLRKLVVAGIVFTIGYVAGVLFGFRAAVADYVEDDAEKLESMADDIYSTGEKDAAELERELEAAVEEAIEEGDEPDSDEPSAFR